MLEELIIKKGESPQKAHERLAQEAFFPVRMQDLFFKNIETEALGELFPGQRLYTDMKFAADLKLDRHVGILDIDRRKIICVVTREHYELVTNEEACEFVQNEIIPKVFSTGRRFLCNQVIMPESRGSCFMDLCCCDYVPPIKFKDVWQPFRRVGNSYNKTVKLSCRLGFCSKDSHDRVIFGEFKVDLSSAHKRGVKKELETQLRKQFSNVSDFEKTFYQRLLLLSKYYFPKKDMLALYCRVFGVRCGAAGASKENVRFHNHAVVSFIVESTKEYFERNGENAYSAFCVLTAFASHPVSWFSPENDVDRFQSMIGAWSMEFAQQVANPVFSIDDYIENQSRNVAAALYRDYDAVERLQGRMPNEMFKFRMPIDGE